MAASTVSLSDVSFYASGPSNETTIRFLFHSAGPARPHKLWPAVHAILRVN